MAQVIAPLLATISQRSLASTSLISNQIPTTTSAASKLTPLPNPASVLVALQHHQHIRQYRNLPRQQLFRSKRQHKIRAIAFTI
ncbi:hypothetical protein [Nostoc commune]|uniref:hypothetical protein n=1 Tax=Nostoc commune TaxID=1178 RepID=UPI0018C636C6|nr:hypothetical protein [Nostoc commune]MBG1258268.1 hypothetical protein [Nostoc commune BAE]